MFSKVVYQNSSLYKACVRVRPSPWSKCSKTWCWWARQPLLTHSALKKKPNPLYSHSHIGDPLLKFLTFSSSFQSFGECKSLRTPVSAQSFMPSNGAASWLLTYSSAIAMAIPCPSLLSSSGLPITLSRGNSRMQEAKKHQESRTSPTTQAN